MSYVGNMTLFSGTKGDVVVSECENTSQFVWNGSSFSEVYPQKVREDANTIHVAIRNAAFDQELYKIECTEDQQFVMWDGSICTAAELDAGMELMPYSFPKEYHVSSNGSIIVDSIQTVVPVVDYIRAGKRKSNTTVYGAIERGKNRILVNRILVVATNEG